MYFLDLARSTRETNSRDPTGVYFFERPKFPKSKNTYSTKSPPSLFWMIYRVQISHFRRSGLGIYKTPISEIQLYFFDRPKFPNPKKYTPNKESSSLVVLNDFVCTFFDPNRARWKLKYTQQKFRNKYKKFNFARLNLPLTLIEFWQFTSRHNVFMRLRTVRNPKKM